MLALETWERDVPEPVAGERAPVRAEEAGGVRETDLQDALSARGAAEGRATRHLVFALLGLSPAAIVPLVGLALEGSFVLIAVLVTLVVLVEGVRFVLARREVHRLDAVVRRLRAPHGERFDDDSMEDGP